VSPETIQNREQDLDLDDRAAVAPVPDLAARLAHVRALESPPGIPCRDCWHRGRRAVLAVLERPRKGPADWDQLLAEARAVVPGKDRHWLDVFNLGRDAALAALEDE
jgi:hypothetical protein